MRTDPIILTGSRTSDFLADMEPFYPRAPWFGGDLQTLRNQFVRPAIISAQMSKRLHFPLSNREAGTLAAILDQAPQKRYDPLILLIHGLGGCEDSKYMRDTAAGLLDAGFDTLRLNLRGAGPSAKSSTGPYHAGLTADVRDVLSRLNDDFPGRPIFAMGFSLGGHLLLYLSGENDTPKALSAAMSICAPVDLLATQRRIGTARNHVYQKALLRWMIRDARNWLPPDDKRHIILPKLRTVRDFDEHIVAPHHGFANAEDYYFRASMQRVAQGISIPTFALHSLDDPWIPADTYEQTEWSDHSDLHVLISRHGGHVGFHGKMSKRPWYLTLAERFFVHYACK